MKMTTYGKILVTYYVGVGAPVGSLNFPEVMCHYLSAAECDLSFDRSEAMVRIEGLDGPDETTGSWYCGYLAEGA